MKDSDQRFDIEEHQTHGMHGQWNSSMKNSNRNSINTSNSFDCLSESKSTKLIF